MVLAPSGFTSREDLPHGTARTDRRPLAIRAAKGDSNARRRLRAQRHSRSPDMRAARIPENAVEREPSCTSCAVRPLADHRREQWPLTRYVDLPALVANCEAGDRRSRLDPVRVKSRMSSVTFDHRRSPTCSRLRCARVARGQAWSHAASGQRLLAAHSLPLPALARHNLYTAADDEDEQTKVPSVGALASALSTCEGRASHHRAADKKPAHADADRGGIGSQPGRSATGKTPRTAESRASVAPDRGARC